MKLIFWEANISGSENTENCLYCLSRSRDAQQAPIRYKICYFIPTICLYLTNKRKTWYQIFFQPYELCFWIGNFLFCTKHENFKNPAIWSESPLIHTLYLTLLLEIILERFFKSRHSDSSMTMWLKSGSEIFSFSSNVEWLQNKKFPIQKSTTYWPRANTFPPKMYFP